MPDPGPHSRLPLVTFPDTGVGEPVVPRTGTTLMRRCCSLSFHVLAVLLKDVLIRSTFCRYIRVVLPAQVIRSAL